jgi:hypothetical protein
MLIQHFASIPAAGSGIRAALFVLGSVLATLFLMPSPVGRCLAEDRSTFGKNRRYFELETPEAKQPCDLWLRVMNPPVPFARDDGKTHLVTELLMTNTGSVPLKIRSIDVLNGATMKALLKLSGEQLVGNMASLIHPADTDIVAAGQTAIVYLDIALDEPDIPDTLLHRIVADNSTRVETVTGAKIAVDKRTTAPVFGTPFSGGNWVAAEACGCRAHHRRGPFNINGTLYMSQRYAIDFLKVVDGKLWSGDDPRDLNAWYTYGQDALAVSDGTVVLVWDGEPEILPFEKNPLKFNVDNVAGNHVMVDIGRGLYVVYAHFQPGSIRVKVGDKVTKGQKIALIGNSGNTGAPHLHIHVMDAPLVIQADGIPFVFERFRRIGHYESLDALLPDPEGTSPEPMIPLAKPREHRQKYPLEMSVISWSDAESFQ